MSSMKKTIEKKEFKPMSYDKYTLEDIYEIFAQAENKVEQLLEFKSMNLPYEINWDQLIKNYSPKVSK